MIFQKNVTKNGFNPTKKKYIKKKKKKKIEYHFFPLRGGYTFQATQAKFWQIWGVQNVHIYYYDLHGTDGVLPNEVSRLGCFKKPLTFLKYYVKIQRWSKGWLNGQICLVGGVEIFS